MRGNATKWTDKWNMKKKIVETAQVLTASESEQQKKLAGTAIIE